MLNPFNYFTHKFDSQNFTLVMNILVKNEADIIAANIRTHAKYGVDAFVVMDNGSTDGTRDILESLKDEVEMTIIDEPSKKYRQKKWMTRLAVLAKKIYKADWVINNDADEFWIPNNHKNLKEYLAFKGGVVRVKRTNMLPTANSFTDEKDFLNSDLEVVGTVKRMISDGTHYSYVLTPAHPKAIINPNGLIKVNFGNHTAEHIAYWKKREIDDIHIYHYPIRSYAQFEKMIENRTRILETVPDVRMGPDYRRFAKIFREGKLEEEYKSFLFSPDEVALLERIGMVRRNTMPKVQIVR